MERFVRIPGRRRPMTKNMIESAIEATRSNAEAARWLGVSYNTYKKWSKYYKLFENKYPDYPKSVLKKRIINEGLLQEECSVCGWNEERITDNKICLSLDYIDGNSENKNYDNLRLLCPNCYFTNVGNFKNSKVFCK